MEPHPYNKRTEKFMNVDSDNSDFESGPQDTNQLADIVVLSEVPHALNDDTSQEPESIFGTFFIGDSEFTFPASNIQEVVPYPEKVTKVPLCPDYVDGIFNLRGTLIPIVDVSHILRLTSSEEVFAKRVAVIDCGSQLVGAVFDRTGEVRYIRGAAQRHSLQHRSDDNLIVEGVVQLDEQDRLVQQLSPELLGAMKDIPKAKERSHLHKMRRFVEAEEVQRAIVIRIHDIEFAFDIGFVLEIHQSIPIQQSPAYFEHCEGVVQLRKRVIPVFSFHNALAFPSAEKTNHNQILFLTYNQMYFALPVDEIVDTVEFSEESLLSFPSLSQSRIASFCTHVISEERGRDIFRVDVRKLYEIYGIADAANALNMQAESDSSVEDEDENEDISEFLVFRVADTQLALPLDLVREIREMDFQALSAKGLEDEIVGLLNLRGTIVPMLDLKRRLNVFEDADSSEDQVVIITKSKCGVRGLVADSVRSIVRIPKSSITDVTSTLDGCKNGILNFVKDALRLCDGAVLVMDLEKVVNLVL